MSTPESQAHSPGDAPFMCATPDCPRTDHHAHGLCNRCYKSACRRAQGIPARHIQLPEAIDAVEFLRPRITVDDMTGCWRWNGSKNSKNYATMKLNSCVVLVHRWAYQAIGGHTIPDSWHIDHQGCPTTLCCNPSHLQAVSPEEHRAITRQRREELALAGKDWEWTPPTMPKNLLEAFATIRLDDGRIAPPGPAIIRR